MMPNLDPAEQEQEQERRHWARRSSRRASVYLAVFGIVAVMISTLYFSVAISALRRQSQAQCQFDADLGHAPIEAPAGRKPLPLGVTVVSDARIAWHRNGCPGALPPPTRSFVRWAHFYHLPEG